MPRAVEPNGTLFVQPMTHAPGEMFPVVSDPLSQFSPLNGSPQPPPCSVPVLTFWPFTHLSFLPAISAKSIVLEVPSVMARMLVCAFAWSAPPRSPPAFGSTTTFHNELI